MALQRPYTFVVMAMLIVVLGALTIARMPTDIFPDIDIPVISVELPGPVQRDGSASSATTSASSRRAVNDIDHIESQAFTGISVVKIYPWRR